MTGCPGVPTLVGVVLGGPGSGTVCDAVRSGTAAVNGSPGLLTALAAVCGLLAVSFRWSDVS